MPATVILPAPQPRSTEGPRQMYREFLQLQLETANGVFFKSPQEANRWNALSRVFTFAAPSGCCVGHGVTAPRAQ
ncbi:MAG: hypothetical protein AB1555_10040 [Nitrospirota bacterium]